MEQDVTLDKTMQDEELAQLTKEQGIRVWGTDHHNLEKQALQELNILTQESQIDDKNDVEEGELIDDKKEKVEPGLDINSYIKRQEELRKIQEYKKTLQVDNEGKLIADKITKKLTKRKRDKRAKSSTNKNVNIERKNEGSGSEYIPSDDLDSDCEPVIKSRKLRSNSLEILKKCKDDGLLQNFKQRLANYYKEIENENHSDDDPEAPDFYTLKGGLKIQFKIWTNLYGYQQDGVRWLWGLHRQNNGGILGDEMGLGKTVQLIAFLAGLEYSQVVDRYKGLGPTLIVCPVTVIHQWVQHFHQWAPEFRVVVLHQSGSCTGNKNHLIKDIHKNKGIIITNYIGVLKYKDTLSSFNWHYVILDEGHKIRNPNAKISVAVKKIQTPHRIMLTGSPMQNNLQELWSLFDFTNPGMLGNLQTFVEHFNNPIVQGGFVNATPMQEAIALQVATTLKNVISPFLLRRSKNDVQKLICLPNKTEQVLFCSLTDHQRDLYKGYLMSDHIGSVLGNSTKNWFSEQRTRANVLISITILRKICNHPDIYLSEAEDFTKEEDWGFYKKSGKMVVVSALLKIWKKQNHRVLLFTQSRQMLVVLEKFLKEQEYKYLKMDGSTAVVSRQPSINKFNEDSSYDVFLLTTRVGGLGVNLTGADRVIIYDPDWNPAVDTQARERAWRIGQDKQVTIYRLLSAGTIEEKMYQRQVWKQLLCNKVLLNPKTHKFFKSSSLHDLFSLPEDANPETTNIFRESRVKFQEKIYQKKKSDKSEIQFTDDKIKAMKNLAQQIAKSISPKKTHEQKEWEKQRQKKLKEKEDLKKLTAQQLLELNRVKEKIVNEEEGNKVDDCCTEVSFSRALQYSEETATTYHKIKGKHPEQASEVLKKTSKKVKDIFKSVIDNSGTIDGEKVDGLVKAEIKKVRKRYDTVDEKKSDSQDQYVLEKLFLRKGVSGALQHESVVGTNARTQSLRVQTEAKERADKALEALRKSRINSWRW